MLLLQKHQIDTGVNGELALDRDHWKHVVVK